MAIVPLQWRSRSFASLLLLVVLARGGTLAANDRVDDLRKAVDAPAKVSAAPVETASSASPSPPKSTDKAEESRRPSEPSDLDDGWDFDGDSLWTAAMLGGLALTSPVWVPATLVNDGERQHGWFTRYPYQHHDSYMTFVQPPEWDNEPWEPSNWSFQFATDFGADFSGQQLLGGKLLLEHVNRFGLDSRLNFVEDRGGPLPGDSLYFGDVNATYRFAHSQHWLFRGGVGMNWLVDRGTDSFGPNFTYQVDWFPTQPLVFSTELDLGRLGDAWLFHFQQTAGVTYRGMEARIGYDYLDVGDAQLGFLLLGVRAWF
jgi:hypothetical protein